MRNKPVKLLDVVALLVDKPAEGLASDHVSHRDVNHVRELQTASMEVTVCA